MKSLSGPGAVRRLRLALALILLVLPAGSPCEATAAPESHLGDTVIGEDSVWQGTVRVDGVAVVARRATLTIEPGTTVLFSKLDRNRDGIGDGELRVLGGLDARGTAAAPITFRSAEKNPAAMDWSYVLLFTSGRKNLIRHCVFENAFTGLQVHFSTAEVDGSTFRHNREGLRFGRSHLTVRNSLFTGNDLGVRFTRMEGPTVLAGNRISGNRIGVLLVPSGQNITDFFEPDRGEKVWNTGRLTITGNDISGNSWYNLALGEKQVWDLDARNNWWGSTEPEAIRGTVFDRRRDPALGEVLVEPFLTAPPTGPFPPASPAADASPTR